MFVCNKCHRYRTYSKKDIAEHEQFCDPVAFNTVLAARQKMGEQK